MHALTLAGDVLEVTVVPAAGGKILELVHRPSRTNLLWRNPRVKVAPTYAGAPFDDVWCGGWDDLFPTDAPCAVDGNLLHDHGDLWTGSWDWTVERDDGDEAVLCMRKASASLPCLLERRLSLKREDDALRVSYRLQNLGSTAVRFMWSIHVAHAVEPGSRLHLPAGLVGVEPPFRGRTAGDEVDWPLGGREGEDLRDGWCAVTHPSRELGLSLSFDPVVFPTVWIFAVYGGWRGHHVLLTEPATGRPGDLERAIAAGDAAALEGGAVLETELVARILTEVDAEAPGDRLPEPPTAEERA
jgi:hypothetical protein